MTGEDGGRERGGHGERETEWLVIMGMSLAQYRNVSIDFRIQTSCCVEDEKHHVYSERFPASTCQVLWAVTNAKVPMMASTVCELHNAFGCADLFITLN